MKADEISSRLEELKGKLKKAFEQTGDPQSLLIASTAAAIIELPLFAGEIALQLAKLNEKLAPEAIFAAFKQVGDMIEKMPDAEKRRNL
jgi:hypothetical protein